MVAPLNTFWTKERTERAIALAESGMDSREIADRLGSRCTRNMVISKFYREGLDLLADYRRIPTPMPLTLFERLPDVSVNGCRYIKGDPHLCDCCGDPVIPPGDWCAKHRSIVYIKAKSG